MRIETPEQVKNWVEANLDYFWNKGSCYFIFDLSNLPIDVAHLGSKFDSCQDIYKLHDMAEKIANYFALDVDDTLCACLKVDKTYEEFSFKSGRLIRYIYDDNVDKNYTQEELIKSFKDLEFLLKS